ncbi:fungal-specific transcription factor domain-containing protein [Lipomyces arxii]|uniref:fungal-specific transcription factor domain-containing protein n=1 Tax=Lipomyces arxii TaxID=56418 RepID=UPI0034CE4730
MAPTLNHNGLSKSTGRRSRVVISCTECHRRKQKCDRNQPCNQCIARKVQSLCRYSGSVSGSVEVLNRSLSVSKGLPSTSVSDNKVLVASPLPFATDLNVSMSRNTPALETLTNASLASGNTSDMPITNGPKSEIDTTETGISNSSFETSDSDFDDEGYGDEDDDDILGYFKAGPSNIARDIAELNLSTTCTLFPMHSNSSRSSRTAMKNKRVVSRILRILPPKPYTTLLVRVFFSEANLHHFINEIEFCESVSKWLNLEDRTENIEVPALVFRLMSIALQHLPAEHIDTIKQIDGSLQNLWRDYSQAACDLATLLPDCVGKVAEHMLYASWLKAESRMKESWYVAATAIRMAQEINLHQEELNTPPSFEREVRRRLWWSIYYWDRCMSLILGRPTMIADNICTVPLPLDLPDRCYYPVVTEAPLVTEFTGRCLCFKLARYISDLDISPDRLHSNLTIFMASLPAYFAVYAPDKSLDAKYPFLVAHREALATTVCMIYCALYRRKVPIPNPLSFCLRLLTAADRLMSLSKENHYRKFMIVYQNLEPSMLICREILKLNGKLTETNYILCDDDRGHVIDVWLCLKMVDEALARLKIVRSQNRMAARAYRILKELLRRVRLQVDTDRKQYETGFADSRHMISGEMEQGLLSVGATWSEYESAISPKEDVYKEPAELTMDIYMANDNITTDDDIQGILQNFDPDNVKNSMQILNVSGGVTSLPPDLICGKVPIRMPIPPSIEGLEQDTTIQQLHMQQVLDQYAATHSMQVNNGEDMLFSWDDIFADNLDISAIGEQMDLGKC